MKDAGIIGFTIEGDYDSTRTYHFLNVVFYEDSSYVAKKDTTGNAPAEDNEFWHILAKGQVTGVSGVKGDKEEKYRTGDVNITANNVGALPITGGTIVSNLNPILELKRNGNWVAIDMVNSFGKLFKIEGSMGSSDAAPAFRINELIAGVDNQKTLFLISSEARRIYDKKTNRLKDILVDGEAVPMTDGVVTRDIVVSTNAFPGINIVREDFDQTAAIQLTNGNQEQNGMLLEAAMVNSEGKGLYFRIRDMIANKELFRISLSERRIYDKESGTLKDILVKGEALPSSGGTLKSTDFFPLHLERTTGATGCGLEFKGTAGSVGNIQMTYDTSSNNENELRCFVRGEDKKDHGVLYVSRDKKKVYSKEAGGLKNIMTDYEVPFRFGIDSSGDYGYYRNDTGEFVKFPT